MAIAHVSAVGVRASGPRWWPGVDAWLWRVVAVPPQAARRGGCGLRARGTVTFSYSSGVGRCPYGTSPQPYLLSLSYYSTCTEVDRTKHTQSQSSLIAVETRCLYKVRLMNQGRTIPVTLFSTCICDESCGPMASTARKHLVLLGDSILDN